MWTPSEIGFITLQKKLTLYLLVKSWEAFYIKKYMIFTGKA